MFWLRGYVLGVRGYGFGARGYGLGAMSMGMATALWLWTRVCGYGLGARDQCQGLGNRARC